MASVFKLTITRRPRAIPAPDSCRMTPHIATVLCVLLLIACTSKGDARRCNRIPLWIGTALIPA